MQIVKSLINHKFSNFVLKLLLAFLIKNLYNVTKEKIMENEEIQDKEIFNKIKDFETKSTFTYDRLQFCLNKGLYFTLCNNLKDFACNYYINFKTNNLNNNLMQTPDENSQKESNNAENINLDSSAFLSFVEEYLQPFFKLNFENFKIEDYQEFLSSYKKINKNSNNEKLNIEELSKKEKNKICNQLAEFKKNLKNVNSANADNLLSNYKLEKEFVKNFLEYYYSKNKHETPKFSLIFNLDKNLKVFVLPSPYFYKDKNFFIDGKFYKEFYLECLALYQHIT